MLIPPIVAGFTWILLNTGPWIPFALWCAEALLVRTCAESTQVMTHSADAGLPVLFAGASSLQCR